MSLPPPGAQDDFRGGPAGAGALSSRLPRSRRGYERAATDVLLAELVSRRADLERDCARLREENTMLHEQLVGQRGQEQLVSRTLLAAMSQAMAIREEARREAERTLRKVSEELRERSARLAQIQSEQAEAERELLRLRGLAKEMQQGLASFLSETLQQLREGISATDGDEEATIVSVLGATLGQEGRQLQPPDSETAGNPATT